MNFNPDFLGTSILFAASVATGKTHKLQIKSTWKEQCNFILAIVGKKGVGKTHPLKFALEPLLIHDKKSYKIYEQELLEYDPKGKEPKPQWRKFLLGDYTPEALINVHTKNRRGIAIYSDELKTWFENLNRYSKSGEESQWLSIWSGNRLVSDRATLNSKYIDNPFIGLTGGIQPHFLSGIFSKNGRDYNGLIDRILFCFPSDIHKEPIPEGDLPEEYITRYIEIINRLIQLAYYDKSVLVKISSEAWIVFRKWENDLLHLANNCDDPVLEGIYTKMDIHTFRIALVLHMIHHITDGIHMNELSSDIMKKAVALTRYFTINGEKVIDKINGVGNISDLPASQANLYKSLPDLFTTADAVSLGEKMEISESTVKRLLRNKRFLINHGRGNYERMY